MNFRRIATLLTVLAILLMLSLSFASESLACPTCKVALANHDTSQGDIVSGFFWSILFMLSMPFLILGGLGTYFYLLIRRARRQQAAAAQRASTMVRETSKNREQEPVEV